MVRGGLGGGAAPPPAADHSHVKQVHVEVCISFQGGLKFEDVIKDTIFAQKEQYTDRRATQNGMVSAGALTFRKTSPESWLTRLLLLLVMSAILAMFHLHV